MAHAQKNSTRTRIFLEYWRASVDHLPTPSYKEVGERLGVSAVTVSKHVLMMVEDGYLTLAKGWRAVSIPAFEQRKRRLEKRYGRGLQTK
jgi:predicted transcriptional regulator